MPSSGSQLPLLGQRLGQQPRLTVLPHGRDQATQKLGCPALPLHIVVLEIRKTDGLEAYIGVHWRGPNGQCQRACPPQAHAEGSSSSHQWMSKRKSGSLSCPGSQQGATVCANSSWRSDTIVAMTTYSSTRQDNGRVHPLVKTVAIQRLSEGSLYASKS